MAVTVLAESKNYTLYFTEDPCVYYFEHNRYGDNKAGHVWITYIQPENKYYLLDYDGVYALPEEVINMLLRIGIVIEGEFYPDFIY